MCVARVGSASSRPTLEIAAMPVVRTDLEIVASFKLIRQRNSRRTLLGSTSTSLPIRPVALSLSLFLYPAHNTPTARGLAQGGAIFRYQLTSKLGPVLGHPHFIRLNLARQDGNGHAGHWGTQSSLVDYGWFLGCALLNALFWARSGTEGKTRRKGKLLGKSHAVREEWSAC